MVPSGPSTPIGGAQSVPPSLLRSNSGMLGAQGGPMPSQGAFPSLVSPRTQFTNANLLGNVPNVSSLLNQSFGNGGLNPGIPGGNGPRSGIDSGAESDSLSGIGSGMGFNPPSSSFAAANMTNPGSSGQVQSQQFPNSSGNQVLLDQPQSQQLEPQNFQHSQQPLQQFSGNQQPQQQQFQSVRGGGLGGGVLPVKMEPQTSTDQHGPSQQQQLQSLRGLGQVKLEPQQLQTMRGIGPVKMEPHHSDQSLFLHQQQQQQQQQLLQQMSMPRQSPQAAAVAQFNILQQQRMLQLQQQQQQQQQQQLLRAIPHQRSQLQQQSQPQNLPLRSPVKSVYEPGTCARRLTQYMYQQQHRPEVRARFFALFPHAYVVV